MSEPQGFSVPGTDRAMNEVTFLTAIRIDLSERRVGCTVSEVMPPDSQVDPYELRLPTLAISSAHSVAST